MKRIGVLMLIGIAGLFLLVMALRKTKQPDLKQFGLVGEYAAEEAVKVIGKTGRITLIYDVGDAKSGGASAGKPFADQEIQVAGFRNRLLKLGSFTFTPDWKLERPNLVFRSVWPAGMLSKLVSANPPDTTFVFFASPPPMTKEEKSLLQARQGKLVVVGGALPDVQWLARERVAHLIVASRYPVPPPTQKSETEWEVVRRAYGVVTPALTVH